MLKIVYMASLGVSKFSCVLLMVCLVVGAPKAKAAITCAQVVRSLSPCITYVTSGGAVPSGCCGGIKSLYGAAQTTGDRQGVCKCLKSTLSGISYSAFNLNQAASLPGKCGISIPYKISPSTDCSIVK